jgi:KDO2-lipid IV(A) lauroyltransferase
MNLKHIKNTLIYCFILFILFVIRRIPRSLSIEFCKLLGKIAYIIFKKDRERIKNNLLLVFGKEKSNEEISQMVKNIFIDLGRNTADALRIPVINEKDMKKLVKVRTDNANITGFDKIRESLKKGKGVIAITGHIGNWELLAAYASVVEKLPANVIRSPLYDKRLDKIIVDECEETGMHVISRDTGAREMIRCLKNNEVLAILADQDTRVDSVEIDFFGHSAKTPTGPVALALKTGAVIVPVCIHIEDDNTHTITIADPLELTITGNKETDIKVNTQKYTKVIEKFIMMKPTQWVWMHKRWGDKI